MHERVERLCIVRVYQCFQISLRTVYLLHLCVDIECVDILCAQCTERRLLCFREIRYYFPELDLLFHHVSPDFVVFVHKFDDLAYSRLLVFFFCLVGL